MALFLALLCSFSLGQSSAQEFPPDPVIVGNTGPATVQVSWQPVEDAERYTIAFTHTQPFGFCSDTHNVSLSVDATTVSIDVGRDVADSVTTMLRAYTTYSITVVAVNNHGSSKKSESIEYITMQTSAAVAPGNVRAVVDGPNNISVQWDGLSPCRLVNGLIVEYRVQYTVETSGVVESTDVPGEWMNGADTKLTGLTPFTSYSIKVAAINEQGHVGLYSNPIIKQTEEDVPGPVIITTAPSFFQITITWSEPAMPNGVITEYEVSYGRTGSSQSATSTGLVASFTLYHARHAMRLDARFTFTVRAHTQVGVGDPATVTVSILTRPPAVERVMIVSVNDSSVNVSWNDMIFPDVSIDRFTVVYRSLTHKTPTNEIQVVILPPSTSCVITELESPAVYQFQVFATVTVYDIEMVGERSNVTYFVNFPDERQDTNCSDRDEAVASTPHTILFIVIGAIIATIGIAVCAVGLVVGTIIATRKHKSQALEKCSKVMCEMADNPVYGISPSTSAMNDASVVEPKQRPQQNKPIMYEYVF